MIDPFVQLANTLIYLYSLAVIAWAIIGLLINFDIINRGNMFVFRLQAFLTQLVEPALVPIRRLLNKLLPGLQGIDISPIILLVLLQFAQNALAKYFMGW